MSHANLNRFFIALLLLLPIPALAQSAFTTQAVNVRAGPDRAFPLVTWLQPGTPVTVIGCTNGWRWCDVVAGGWRGWGYSRYLSGPIRSRAPVITFSVGSYWGAHYRGRPWYSSQSSLGSWIEDSRRARRCARCAGRHVEGPAPAAADDRYRQRPAVRQHQPRMRPVAIDAMTLCPRGEEVPDILPGRQVYSGYNWHKRLRVALEMAIVWSGAHEHCAMAASFGRS